VLSTGLSVDTLVRSFYTARAFTSECRHAQFVSTIAVFHCSDVSRASSGSGKPATAEVSRRFPGAAPSRINMSPMQQAETAAVLLIIDFGMRKLAHTARLRIAGFQMPTEASAEQVNGYLRTFLTRHAGERLHPHDR
jgi:hypothetical protein